MQYKIFCDLSRADWQLIKLAFMEDLGLSYRDLTTNILFAKSPKIAQAQIISKNSEPLVLCGVALVEQIIAKLPGAWELEFNYQDGDVVPSRAVILKLRGPLQTILMIERVLLNFLQHLCAISSMTYKFVKLVEHTSAKILDTRKTLPGLRRLEKYAVRCGGGVNHRMGLYDAVMVKDNHIDLLGGLEKIIEILPEKLNQEIPVIIEVRDLKELNIILQHGLSKVTRVLLDNMDLDLLRASVEKTQGKISTEASGNINLNNVRAVAETGVDFISIGKLTHSADHVDLSMSCQAI